MDAEEAKRRMMRLIFAGVVCPCCGAQKLIQRPHYPFQVWCYGCGVASETSPALLEECAQVRAEFEAYRERWDNFWSDRTKKARDAEKSANAAPTKAA